MNIYKAGCANSFVDERSLSRELSTSVGIAYNKAS